MTTFAQDAFTDTDNTLLENHTGETGATWTKHGLTGTGSAQITNANRLQNGTANSVIYRFWYASICKVTRIVYFQVITDECGWWLGGSHQPLLAMAIAYALAGQYKLSRSTGVETVLGLLTGCKHRHRLAA